MPRPRRITSNPTITRRRVGGGGQVGFRCGAGPVSLLDWDDEPNPARVAGDASVAPTGVAHVALFTCKGVVPQRVAG